jgi:hypothetical protein
LLLGLRMVTAGLIADAAPSVTALVFIAVMDASAIVTGVLSQSRASFGEARPLRVVASQPYIGRKAVDAHSQVDAFAK